jgi:hypothetical protein
MLTAEEAIEQFKDFEYRANTKRDKQINRIKDDREFLSGSQWDATDNMLIDNTRPKRVVNVLANSVNATVNVYATYPYKWYCRDEEADQACEAFLKSGSNARAAYDALYGNTAFGLSYLAIGSETLTDTDGTKVDVPALYCVDKTENVYYDPDSVEMDGHDAMEAAIVEFKSKAWVKAKYGEDWVTEKGVAPVVNVTANSDPDTMVIVTYYVMEDDKCHVYRMLNNDFLDEPVELDIDRIPVFPVYGERTWENGDVMWQGLVRKGAPIQKMLNYAFTQLSERMAMSPKPIFLTRPEAVEGYSEGYRNFARNINPLLLYHPCSADGKIQYEPPQRIDNKVQFDDITGIIGSNLDLLSTITGVDAKGVMNGDAPQVTATEVLYNERQAQTTIRHYYANLRDTFKSVGETVLQLLNFGRVNVDVIQGPADAMQLQVARQELMQLMSVVPEDKRMQLVNGIFMSHPDNAVLRNVLGAINTTPGPTPLEQQAMATVETMKDAIVQKDQQIQELQDQIKRMEDFNANNDKSLMADFVKAKIDHQYKQEDMILQAQLDQGLDADKAALDAEKAEIDLQTKAIQLDTARVKANTEIAKAMQPVKQGAE